MPLIGDRQTAVIVCVVAILNASSTGDDQRVLTVIDGLRKRVREQELITAIPSFVHGNSHSVIDRTGSALECIDLTKIVIRPRRGIELLHDACSDLIPTCIEN